MYSIAASRGPPSFTRTPDYDVTIDELDSDSVLRDTSSNGSINSCKSSSQFSAVEVQEKIFDQRVTEVRDSGNSSKSNCIIEYDKMCEERCSHTTVQPSKMMALAMELQISNRGKASKMFRLGKLKAQDNDDDIEDVEKEVEELSKLANLWVVPDTDGSFQGDTLATHLQPSLVNTDFVLGLQQTLNPLSSNGFSQENENSASNEMQAEDLALIADITVADLVGTSDHDDWNSLTEVMQNVNELVEGLDEIALSQEEKENVDLTADLTTSMDDSASALIKRNDNENEMMQEREKIVLESLAVITSPHKETTYADTIRADQRAVDNGTAASINYELETTNLSKKDQLETNSLKNVESITSDKVKLSLNAEGIADSEWSKCAFDASSIDDLMLTSSAMSEGRNDYRCKSVVSDHHEKCSDNPSNETALNGINTICKENRSTVLDDYCEEQLLNSKQNQTKLVLTDNNNNLLAAESNDQKPELTLNSSSVEESCNSVETDGNRPKHDVSKKNLDEGVVGDNKPRNKVAKPFSESDFDLPVYSDSILSSLSSSLVSVTSMDSSATDSTQSLLMNSSSRPVMTSCDAKFDITSQETKTTSSNYRIYPSPLAHDDNETVSDVMVSNNKESTDCNPNFTISNNTAISIELTPSTCTKGNKNSSKGQYKTHDNNDSAAEEIDCGVQPRPWSASLQEKSEKQKQVDFTDHNEVTECQRFKSDEVKSEKDLLPQTVVSTIEVACNSEVSSLVDSENFIFKNGLAPCSGCENNMAFCCCATKREKPRNFDNINAQDSESCKKYVQIGEDPIVESLRISQKKKNTASSNDVKKELSNNERITTHVMREGIEIDGNLNDKLASKKMQFVVDDNTNVINGDLIQATQMNDSSKNMLPESLAQNTKEEIKEIAVESAKKDPESEHNATVRMIETKVMEEQTIKPKKSWEQDFEALEIAEKLDASETSRNKNPRVNVLNDSAGSKISLKKSGNGVENVESSSLHLTSQKLTAHEFDCSDKSNILERKQLTTETIKATTAAPLEAKTTAEKSQLSKIEEILSMSEVATLCSADALLSVKKEESKISKAEPSLSNVVARKATTETVEVRENGSLVENKSEVVGVGRCSISLSRDHSRNKSILGNPATRVAVRTSASKPKYIRTNEAAYKKAREKFNGAEEKRHNLLRTSSMQYFSKTDSLSKPSRLGTASPKTTYSSSVFVSIGSQKAKSPEERPVTDSSWRLKQRNPTRRAASVTSRYPAVPQRTSMYRQWTNPTMSVPAEQPVQSQIQVPQENTNRNTENAPSKPEVSDEKSTSSRISLRTGVSQKPPLSPILGQISTSRRFEKQTVQQRNDGSRFKSYTKRDRKEMSVIGDGSVPRSETSGSVTSNYLDGNESGVVTSPRMTVKEIRARYKSRDYESFAIPKTRTVSSSNNSSRKGSEEYTKQRKASESHSEVFHDDNNSNHQVAEQVMGLFKGALDFEKELAVFEQEVQKSRPSQTQHITPLKQNGHVIVRTSSSSDQQEAAKPTSPIIKSSPRKMRSPVWPPPQNNFERVEKTDIKASVQQIKNETQSVSSFDESLDLFYNVLNDLSS